MSSILNLTSAQWWQMAGWTMVHYLWLGTAVAAAAWIAQLILRRATPNIRYAAALSALGILTALPVAIAGWLVSTGPAMQVAAAGDGSAGIEKGVGLEPGAGSDEPLATAGASALAAAGSSLEHSPTIELTQRMPTANGDDESALASTNGAKVSSSNLQSTGRDSGTPSIDVPKINFVTQFTSLCDPIIAYLPWLWLVGSPITFGLLATGLVGTRRMRSAGQVIETGEIFVGCTRLSRSLGVTRQVAIAMCERVAAPVLIGILRPVILLPPAAITGWSPAEIEMVLLHELAHVRRWDNLVNLLQRVAESLLFFHPAVWLVSNWVRREREACCDAIVVGHTHQPRAYAEMLVAIAARLPRSALFAPAAATAMAAGPLRFRIRQILKLEDDPMLVSGKSFTIAIGSLLTATMMTALYWPGVGLAQDSNATQAATGQKESTPSAFPNTVKFNPGKSQFLNEDHIEVLDVRGTADEFRPSNSYRIKGNYKLGSRDRARLSVFVTAENSATGNSSVQQTQSTIVDRGEGSFELILPMLYEGAPHVSFYPADGGEGFGGVYFASGNQREKSTQTPADRDEIENAFWQAVFKTSDVNSLGTMTYEVFGTAEKKALIFKHLQGWQLDPYGPQLKFNAQWSAGMSHVKITASNMAQEVFFAPLLSHGDEERLAADTAIVTSKFLLANPHVKLDRSAIADIEALQTRIADLNDQRGKLLASIMQLRKDNAALLIDLPVPVRDTTWQQQLMRPFLTKFRAQTAEIAELDQALVETVARLQLATAAIPQPAAQTFTTASLQVEKSEQSILIPTNSLRTAVRNFNEKAQQDAIGRTQPALTEEEVIASIRGWMRESVPVSDDVYALYEKIAETQNLPPNATFEFNTVWENESRRFDVWWITLVVKPTPQSGFAYRIRDVKLRSRSLTPDELQKQSQVRSKSNQSQKLEEWDNLVAEVPRLDAVAVKQAWEKYGLKLLPTLSKTAPLAIRQLHGGGDPNVQEFNYYTIVGGNLPANLPPNSILFQVDGDQPIEPGQLYSAVKDPRPKDAECIAYSNGQTYVFRTQPPAANPAPSTVASPADQTLYQQQMRFENGQLLITLSDAQMQAGLRTRILSVVDAVAPSATVRMEGNELTIFGVDADQMSTITKLIRGALMSGIRPNQYGGTSPQTISGFGQPATHGGLGVTTTPARTELGVGPQPLAGNYNSTVNPTIETARVTVEAEASTPRGDENIGRAALRYEGRTFDAWRDAWQTELSAEKRLAALKALVAFGANGYGKQAAEAILDVTKLYDLSVDDNLSTTSTVAQLRQQAEAAFGWEGNSQAIPWRDWLPALATKVRSGDPGSVLLTDHIFRKLENSVGNRKSLIATELLTLSRDPALRPITAPILRLLSQFNLQKKDKQIDERMVEALKNSDVEVVLAAVNALYMQPFQRYQNDVQMSGLMNLGAPSAKPAFELEYRPELAELLRSGGPALRSSVFGALQLLGPKAAPAVPDLLPLTLEKSEGSIDWPAAAEQTISVITGTDQTVYQYWRTIVDDHSQPAEKIAIANERIKNWEVANKQRETDLKRSNEGPYGRERGAAPPQPDPRGR